MSKRPSEPPPPLRNFTPICAIGAAAGGVGALQSLLRQIPDDLGLAYVVVLHLSPEHPSAMHEILGACTKMQVHQVNDGPKLQPNCVYVIPPDHELVIDGDRVQSRPFTEPRGRRAPIDLLFRSVASARGDSIALVLTGAGADGALGVRAIKEAGGVVMAQEPTEADFPMMPQNAIATGAVDFVAPIARLAERITEVARSKEAENALRESEERLRSAVAVGRLGLWDWNTVTGEVHWSDEHYRMLGYAVGEVTPSYEAWLGRIHPEDRADAEAALNQAMTQHVDYVREVRSVFPDGSIHWLSSRGRFFYDEAGQAIRMVGAMIDNTDRRDWEDRQTVLVGELQHRTRNLMAVVRSIADKTARASVDVEDFRVRFRGRLDALARVQGLLSRLNEHDRVTFDELIRTELLAMNGNADHTTLEGPPGIRLRSSSVQMLAMALHELATNAVKYGALGQPGARLTIAWSLAPNAEAGRPWLNIDWRETGVAMPAADTASRGSGQGRELIEQALPYQLKARTSYVLEPDGVHCTISIPVSASTDA